MGAAPRSVTTRTADVLVVGSGAAGLAVALHAGSRRVTMLSKTAFAEGGSSSRAQGGVAAALGKDDSPERHAADTVAAGCGLAVDGVVRMVANEAPQRIRELLALGARFDRDGRGTLALGREGAHSRRRILHAAGDATGAELMRALGVAATAKPGLEVVDDTLALDLLQSEGRVCGVVALTRRDEIVVFRARDVVLASGGSGQLFLRTTNPAEATGDGLAMAARAGARLAGLEFVQFHPTAMAMGGNPMPLLTEALRGEGAHLVDSSGRRIMEGVHPLGDLAPRDLVARTVWRNLEEGRQVLLDTRVLGERMASRFPTVLRLCLERGLDPRLQPIPVTPAAHYHMGGVAVDHEGRASLAGLWACGEVAHSGLHGANRLASNSLLEALVYGARAGEALARGGWAEARRREPFPDPDALRAAVDARPWLGEAHAASVERLRTIMWQGAGLERSASGLSRALSELGDLEAQLEPGLGELANMLLVAGLVMRAAAARTESRGAHFRSDIPWPDPHWRQDVEFEGLCRLEPHPVAVAG